VQISVDIALPLAHGARASVSTLIAPFAWHVTITAVLDLGEIMICGLDFPKYFLINSLITRSNF
jgi:hypothetical protein